MKTKTELIIHTSYFLIVSALFCLDVSPWVIVPIVISQVFVAGWVLWLERIQDREQAKRGYQWWVKFQIRQRLLSMAEGYENTDHQDWVLWIVNRGNEFWTIEQEWAMEIINQNHQELINQQPVVDWGKDGF